MIGFFFLVGIIMKMVNSFLFLLSGKAFQQNNNSSNDDNRKDFDSWEEVE
jgi:hypothetical protein